MYSLTISNTLILPPSKHGVSLKVGAAESTERLTNEAANNTKTSTSMEYRGESELIYVFHTAQSEQHSILCY